MRHRLTSDRWIGVGAALAGVGGGGIVLWATNVTSRPPGGFWQAWGYVLVTVAAVGSVFLLVGFFRTDPRVLEERNHAAAERDRALKAALRFAPCRVSEAHMTELGIDAVDPAVLERVTTLEDGQLPYIAREADRELRLAVARARDRTGPALVCAYGPSKAGKSRSLLEALRAELPDAAIVAPKGTRSDLQMILDSGLPEHAAAKHGGRVVLWLDDLEGFVRDGSAGLDVNTLATLRRELPALAVAATAGGRGRFARPARSARELFEPLEDLIDSGIRIRITEELTTVTERESLAAVVPPDLAIQMQAGLGATAVSGRRLVDILVNKSHPDYQDGRISPEGAAVTWCAVAAYRAGFTEPIPDDLLRKLFACYQTDNKDEAFAAGKRWATTPLYGRASPLLGADRTYAPYDYLVQHAPAGEPRAEQCIWRELLNRCGESALLRLGHSALARGAIDSAKQAFRRADERGSASGAMFLGGVLYEHGDRNGAERCFRRADDGGNPDGAVCLGILLSEANKMEDAEEAWRRADTRGSAEGALRVGILLYDRGALDGAEEAFRRADERASTTGAVRLAGLLWERGDRDGAREAWQHADERGSPEGALAVGVASKEAGDFATAEEAFRRADERGSSEGALSLGLLLAERDDSDGAEAAFRRADQRGNTAGTYSLGRVLHRRRDLDGAEAAYRRAVAQGHLDALFYLGLLRMERDDPKQAEEAFRTAESRGSIDAAYGLAVLLAEQGDREGAGAAYRRMRGSADPELKARAERALRDLDADLPGG